MIGDARGDGGVRLVAEYLPGACPRGDDASSVFQQPSLADFISIAVVRDDAALGVDKIRFDGVENPLGVLAGVVVVGVGVVCQQRVGRECVAAGEDG